MKTITAITILVLFIIIGCTSDNSRKEKKEQIFDCFNFEKGGYKVYFVYWTDPPISKIADSLGEFYISDSIKLCELKDNWNLPRNDLFYACGFDYNIIITYKGKESLTYTLNIDCKSLVTGDHAYRFELENLNFLRKNLTKLRKVIYTDLDKNEELEILRNAKKDSILGIPDCRYSVPSPFKGYFKFSHKLMKGESENLIKEYYSKLIAKTIPKDTFSIEFLTKDSNNVNIRVYCSKDKYDKLKIKGKDKFNPSSEKKYLIIYQ